MLKFKTYIFFRKEGWYPVDLRDDDDAIVNAMLNPGTIRVVDINGVIVWPIGNDNKEKVR